MSLASPPLEDGEKILPYETWVRYSTKEWLWRPLAAHNFPSFRFLVFLALVCMQLTFLCYFLVETILFLGWIHVGIRNSHVQDLPEPRRSTGVRLQFYRPFSPTTEYFSFSTGAKRLHGL